MPTVSLHTLGCKLNFAESSAIGKQFLDRGFEIVEFGQPADVCVINTCSVTARANRECRQVIRKSVRTSAEPFVIVTGCYAQLEPEEVASIDGVDLVVGAKEKFDLFDHVGSFEKSSHPRIVVSDIEAVNNFGPAYTTISGNRTRAYLKVQDGCDFNCSFCTIPLARGTSRSQSLEECIVQARTLVAHGFKEITLTGVNVGDYGKKQELSLVDLLKALDDIEGLARVRISSIEPNLLTDEIINLIATSSRLCRHFHIPLQSGSDTILRAMRRRYSTNDYRSLINRITYAIPDCGIGADVIVGFPGETERHFSETVEFIEQLPVSYLHIFTYSERPNTPAAVFGNSVEPKVRFKRSEVLRLMGQKKKSAFAAFMVGRILPVLFEEDCEDGLRLGFAENYVRVGVPADLVERNEILPVRIREVQDGICFGEPVAQQVAA
ncbi:MAG: tRNA (N(6)-L-threonylcarbamoyladenosine(37)-C(2))-methylthiotransferase MtaB [Bacteroidota bacterium]